MSGSASGTASIHSTKVLIFDAAGVELDSYQTGDLQLSGGTFSGSTIFSGGNDEIVMRTNDGSVQVETTLEEADGSRQTIRSNPIPIDIVAPYILRTSLVAPDRIRVDFSEPVRITDPIPDQENPLDWQIDGKDNHPKSVEGTGAVRYLNLLTPKDQDATPDVFYWLTLPGVNGNGLSLVRSLPYLDRARQALSGNINRRTNAIDRIAPTVPTLEQVAGMANNSVDAIVANDPTPAARLSGLRAGHVGQLWLESNDAEGFQAGDTLLGESVAGDDGIATIEVDEELALPEDRRYTLYGVARDRAKCWPADGPESPECPNHSAADPAYYELDTVAPKALYGLVTSQNNIDVVFTEYVYPDGGDAAQWQTSLGGNVTDVSGTAASEKKRTLTVDGTLPGIADVTWDPAAGTFGPYRDLAGNELQAFALTATDALPPLVDVDIPSARVVTPSQNLFRIGGTASNAQFVKIYRKLDDNSIQFLSEVNVLSNGTWTADVPLIVNAENRLVVRGFRVAASAEILGPEFDVPTIVQDSLAPEVGQVDVHPRELYDGSHGFKGGDTTDITWNAGDANLLPSPFKLELSVDGGATWRLLTTAVGRTVREFRWTLDRDTTDAAMVRVTVTDEAGWTSSAASGLFVIDSTLPHFTPKTTSATTIDVLFSEPVATDADEVNRFEWRVDGSPVLDAQPQTNDADETMMDAVRLTVLPTDAIKPNETPCVAYVPIEAALEDAGCGVNPPSAPTPQFKKGFTDRADNPIEDTKLTAIDAIAPLAPSLGAAPALTGQNQISLTGSAEQDATNKAIARRSDGKTFSGTVGANGAFTLPVELLKDQVSTFQVLIEDPATNRSEARSVSVEQDGTAPKVTIKAVQLRRSGARRIIRVKWDSVDKHRHVADVLFRLRSRTLRIAAATPDDGSFVWRVPKNLRGKRVKMTVITTDLVGNRSQAWSKWVRIR